MYFASVPTQPTPAQLQGSLAHAVAVSAERPYTSLVTRMMANGHNLPKLARRELSLALENQPLPIRFMLNPEQTRLYNRLLNAAR